MATAPKEPAKKRTMPPNRMTLTFGTKYAALHDAIVLDAQDDDREPGEYLVRWLNRSYPQPKE